MSSGSSHIDPQEVDERNASTPNIGADIVPAQFPVLPPSNDRSTGTRRRGRRVGVRSRRLDDYDHFDQLHMNNHYRPYVARQRVRNNGSRVNRNVQVQVEGNRITLQLRLEERDARNANNIINIDIGTPEGSSTTLVATLSAGNNAANNENNSNNQNNSDNQNSPAIGDNAQEDIIDRDQ